MSDLTANPHALAEWRRRYREVYLVRYWWQTIGLILGLAAAAAVLLRLSGWEIIDALMAAFIVAHLV